VIYALVVLGLALGLYLVARVKRLEDRVKRLEAFLGTGTAPYRELASRPQVSILPDDASRDELLLEELRRGNVIGAIRRHRELTGAGLKESKEAVEAIRDRIASRAPTDV
jgi:ribosomal protein L7/L12